MFNCGQEVIDLFNREYRQVVRIHFDNGKQQFDITEADIVQGGMTVDRYCVSGSKIEMGSAIASELTIKLKNYDGHFDDVSFEGASLFVQVGICKWDAGKWENAVVHWIPCGYFIIDTPPRTLSTISISALDRMVRFDREVDEKRLKFPMHVDALVRSICDICGVSLVTDVSSLPNHIYSIGSLPSTSSTLTYRQLLQWCAAMTGTCAFMDANGQLVMKWYEQVDVTITPSERYNSDMLENDIVITGFTCTGSDNATYLAGSDDYAINMSDCGLLTNTYAGVLKELYAARGGFRYRPYTATIKAAPYLFPLDMIHYQDKSGGMHDTIVTNVTFTLNCNTSIAGSGETATSNSYSSGSGMTTKQASAINGVQNEIKVNLSEQALSARDLAQLTVNSMGLNVTIMTSDSGVMTYYYHDGQTLSSSNIIYTLLGGTFAYTTDYNHGNPLWQYGYTQESSIILRSLMLYQITSDYIADGAIEEKSLSKEYLDKVSSAISHALSEAEQYTNTKTGDAKTYADGLLKTAKAYTDELLTQAKGYADGLFTVATQYTDSAAENTLSDAKSYADAQDKSNLEVAKNYAESVGTNTLNSAKSYADGKLTEGKEYTDEQVAAAKSYADSVGESTMTVANGYTDSAVAEAQQQATEYTDRQVETANAGVAAAKKMALLLYIEGEDGAVYACKLRCIDGKPCMEYERSEDI